MTIQITVDGSPFLIDFIGTIDISRMADETTVQICKASKDAAVFKVDSDDAKVEAFRADTLQVQRSIFDELCGGFSGFKPSTEWMWVFPVVQSWANKLGLELYHAHSDEMLDEYDPKWHHKNRKEKPHD